jgi:hypothetical protein
MIRKVTNALRASLMLGLTMSAASVVAQVRNAPSPVITSLIQTPDARAAGMGDAGVATSNADGDANAIFWNQVKCLSLTKILVFLYHTLHGFANW